jgi:hypothetical protein
LLISVAKRIPSSEVSQVTVDASVVFGSQLLDFDFGYQEPKKRIRATQRKAAFGGCFSLRIFLDQPQAPSDKPQAEEAGGSGR